MERIERIEGLDARPTPPPPRTAGITAAARQAFLVILVIGIFLLLWEVLARAQDVPTFFLPKPSDIAQRFARAAADGTLSRHLFYTWAEALAAFGVALVFSTTLGYVLAKSASLERIVSPFIVASQSLPIFAIAPFVLILFGNGFWSNAFMGALVAFFPMLVNNISALRNIDPEQREVLRSYAASTGQVFAKLEVPATLPYLFGSMRVGITLSVIGVLVVELFWGDRGIGFLLNFARGQFDTPLLFAGILALILMNLTMYGILALLQRLVMPWRYTPR